MYSATVGPVAHYHDFIYAGTTTHAQLVIKAATDSVFTAYFDNFSIKEVGTATGWTDADQQLDIPQTALQSYNQLAWFNSTSTDTDYAESDASDTDIDITTGDFSVSCWFMLNKDFGSGTNPYVWRKGGAGSEGYAFIAQGQGSGGGGKFRMNIDDDVTDGGPTSNHWMDTASNACELGRWYHAVTTYDRSGLGKMYINGEERGDNDFDGTENLITSEAATISNSSPLLIGAATSTSNPFPGVVTEWAMFKGVVLSQAEVNELYNDGKALDATTHSQASSYLTAYWRNNGLAEWKNLVSGKTNDINVKQGTETILQQAGVDSSRDCQGFLMNRQKDTNTMNFTTGTQGRFDKIDISNNPLSNLTDDFSVSLWVKEEFDNTGFHCWLVLGESDTSHLHIGSEGGTELNLSYEVNGVTSRPRSGTGVIPVEPGEWTHVVVCFSSGTHTGSDNASVLTDSAASWTADELIDGWLHRLQSSTSNYVQDITDNDGTTVTGSLTSGDYDEDDKYNIIKLYINGDATNIGSGVTGGANEDAGNPDEINAENDTYRIGSTPIQNRAFNGQLDEIMIYSKWLTAAEVKRNYNAGKRSHRNPV